MPPVNLVTGQYQIENLVMGVGTPYRVTGFEIQPYATQAADFQSPRQDTTNFGADQITPGPLNITLEVLQNRWLNGANPGVALQSGSLGRLAQIWRADGVRYQWGEMQTLYYCGNDGILKEIYGRTGKFSYPRGYKNVESYEVVAEFRRADTVSYEHIETYQEMVQGDVPKYVVASGDAQTWGRILIVGPMTNPTVTIGEQSFKINISLDANEAAEISSYPWRRRAVDSSGINIRAYMSGIDYLDKMKVYPGVPLLVRWTSDEVNTWIPELGNRNYKVDIDDMYFWQLPKSFDIIGGNPVVRWDIFNFGSHSFPWLTPTKYIGSGIFGTTSACLYKKDTYNTAKQFSQSKIVEAWPGRSGIVIMSNDDMTNYAMLEIKSSILGTNEMVIRTGTDYQTYSAAKASWTNPVRWKETDIVSIEFDDDTGTFHARLNGEIKCSWSDSGTEVNRANRRQGYIFDLDGNLGTFGTGFKDMVSYDMGTVPTPVGKVYFLWKNAYQVIN